MIKVNKNIHKGKFKLCINMIKATVSNLERVRYDCNDTNTDVDIIVYIYMIIVILKISM